MFNSNTTSSSETGEFAFNDQNETSPGLSNELIAGGLEEIARRLPHDARNQTRRTHLSQAAQRVRASPGAVSRLVEADGVEGVHRLGINYELSGLVVDWVRTGRLPWLERLKVQGRAELLDLPSIGPRLAQELRDVLGVVDLEGLARVAREGRLSTLCGFGPKRLKLVAGMLAARGHQVGAL